jgi:urease accessory protein
MASPFPPSSSAPGDGQLIVHLLPHGISALSTMTFQYPLKLISPSPAPDQKSVLVFLLTYGGGLVGGDQVHLTIKVKPKAKLSVVTQGHTKIFKSPSRDVVTQQHLHVTISDGAAVCLLPDPVQPFNGSVYEQYQRFFLADTGSLCLLVWVSQGRSARGENWDFLAWSGRNEVWSSGSDGKQKLLLRDNVILDGISLDGTKYDIRGKMNKLGLFGTLVLRGPMVENLANFFLTEFSSLPRIGARDFRSQAKVDSDSGLVLSHLESWRNVRLDREKEDGILWSAAKVRGCTVVKFGSHTVEGGRIWIGSMLKEEGSISQLFGEQATLCIR